MNKKWVIEKIRNSVTYSGIIFCFHLTGLREISCAAPDFKYISLMLSDL
jgi:hypothetical protein